MKLKFYSIFFLIGLLLAISITGCKSTEDTSATTGTSTTKNSSQYPIIIEHAFGETVIESKPENISAISWGNPDVPLALGIEPVGISMANYGVRDDSGLLPWTKEAFNELGVESPVIFNDITGLDYEAIHQTNPDVILAAYSGITQEEYDLLSEIAPVVAYPENAWQTYWREQILLNSKGIGMEAEGRVLVEELDHLIAEKASKYVELKGKKAAFFWFTPTDLGKFYVYLPTDPRVAYLKDLGMEFPQSVLEIAEGSESFALELSAENADLLVDVDLIVTYGNSELLQVLQNDVLIGRIPAIQTGSVVVIEDGTPLAASATPSALSIPATIDSYLELLAEAASKVD